MLCVAFVRCKLKLEYHEYNDDFMFIQILVNFLKTLIKLRAWNFQHLKIQLKEPHRQFALITYSTKWTCKCKNWLKFKSKQNHWTKWSTDVKWYECVVQRCNLSFDDCVVLHWIQIGSCGFFLPSACNKAKTFWIGPIFNIYFRPFSEITAFKTKLFSALCVALQNWSLVESLKSERFFKANISFALHLHPQFSQLDLFVGTTTESDLLR